MKTLKDFFKDDTSGFCTLIGLCFALLASCPLLAISENQHPTGEQTFSACFFAILFLAFAVFFMWLAIKEFNDSRKVR